MSSSEFLTVFTKHLRVASPKREDIIAEIKNHLSETDEASVKNQIGDPRRLAHQLNRVHIGFFSTTMRILFTPLVVAISIMALGVLIPEDATDVDPSLHSGVLYYSVRAISTFTPFILAILVGRALGKSKLSSWTYRGLFVSIYLATFFVILQTTTAISPDNLEVELFGVFSISLTLSLFLSLVTVLPIMFVKPLFLSVPQKALGLRLFVELIVLAFIAIIGSFVIRILTEMAFVPYDVVFTDQRPAIGTVWRDVNDFFESGVGTFVFPTIVQIMILILAVRRLREYLTFGDRQVIVAISAFGTGVLAIAAAMFLHAEVISLLLLFIAGIGIGLSTQVSIRTMLLICMLAALPSTFGIFSVIFELWGNEGFAYANILLLSIFPSTIGVLIGRQIRLRFLAPLSQ